MKRQIVQVAFSKFMQNYLGGLNYSVLYRALFKKFTIFLVVQIINNLLEYFSFYHKSIELFWGMLCFWIFFDSVSVVQESKQVEQENKALTEKYGLLLQLYHREQKLDLVIRELAKHNSQLEQIYSNLNTMKYILHRKSMKEEKKYKVSRPMSPDIAPTASTVGWIGTSPNFTFKIEQVSTETEDNYNESFCKRKGKGFYVIPPLTSSEA